ncbi:hypothetical protein IC229_22350 [Spirosoma sp. BT702]|uniref:Peptidase M1 membrane alanine aminopeptidase domain-containing protein n=1 Tax=Spirosoma profusum TaxID=2771354 RepID=A0A926XZ00_9BACT|nr:hypothetical protein [Spirosoma profusum]MBD2703402.1 hypothetical protein [Spirosoma profusum]
MTFGEIFRFEISYQFRHVSTWLLFAFFFLFGFIILRLVTLTDGTYLNAPGTITFFTVFGSAIWVVIGGVIVGDTATRDVQTRMHPLTYTAPVSKFGYLGARFLAALALNSLLLLTLYAGFLGSLYGPGAKTQFVSPFRPDTYLANFAFLALPTSMATTAIQFMVAALSGRAIASYIASISIILFSQFGGTTVRFALEWKTLGGLMDLLGTSIIAEMEGWTPIEKNTRLVLLEGPWLWNRLTWLGIAVSALVYTYFRFQMSHQASSSRRSLFRSRQAAVSSAAQPTHTRIEYTSLINVPDVPRYFSRQTQLHQVLAIAGQSFWSIAKSWTGLTLVAVLALGTGLLATEYMEWLGVPLLARTQEVLNVLTPPLSSYKTHWIIIPLLIIFYAGELIWREREAGLHELSDTTPTPEWVLFIGKFGGLTLIITIWVAFLMLAGIINQLVMGYYQFELDVYVKALFGIQLTNYLLFALLIFVLHVLVNQKYIGHVVAFGAYGFLLFASMLGVEYKLLIYGSDPGWSYSDMSGFDPYSKPWLWFKLYWVSWAVLLAILAILFWVRSKEGGPTARFQRAKHRYSRHKMALFVALAFVVGTGGLLFYNTNVLNVYLTKSDRMALRADYERRYGRYEHAARPVLTHTKLQVEIYPEEQAADIRGTFSLINRSNKAIDSIHLSTIPFNPLEAISFNRPASSVVADDKLGYHIYSLKKPLAPGDSVQMRFVVHIKPTGFSNEGIDASIVANGSHITSDWMPVIGYQANRQIRSVQDRLAYGLPPRAERPSLYDVAARNENQHAELMGFDALVGTSKSQIAVAPGALQRTWTKGDRRYFQYATNAPILNEYAFFSAKYAVQERQWVHRLTGYQYAFQGPERVVKPVIIQIFYHPSHAGNVARMMKSAQASLAYYTQEFGAYPYTHFRVLERPGHGRGMHAEPMTIDYQEGYSLMNPQPGGLDLPYHIMAHEVAHQWWGLYLAPAAVEGAGLLVESLATYSAMQVVEETLGREHLLRYLSQMRQEYKVPRSRAAPPLLRSNNSFLNYRKGPFALYALRNYIGKKRVNDALRQLLRTYTPAHPLPTTLDFYRELQAVTPDSLHYLLHDLFATNTFWDLKTEQATAKQTKTGAWQVTLTVDARKMRVDSMGRETNVPMNDWIEIGVFAPAKNGQKTGLPIYLQKKRIRFGKQRITVMVPDKLIQVGPIQAGIDPNHLLIDYEMNDNMKALTFER